MKDAASVSLIAEVNVSDSHDKQVAGGPKQESPRGRFGWPRKVAMILTTLALVAVGGMAFQYANLRVAQSAVPPPQAAAIPVTSGKATSQDLPIERSGLANVTPLKAVDVKVLVDGQIQRIAFTEGQEVKAGDLLAEIDPRPYQALLAQAEAMLAKDSAQLADAKAEEARAQKLAASGAGTMQAVDTARAQREMTEAMVAGDAAAVSTAKLNLDYATITAPIAGRVGLLEVSEGTIVHASDATGLVTVTQMRPIAVEFALPQEDLPELVARQAHGELQVSVDSTDGLRHLADGRLAVIDSQIDTTTGMVKLKAVFDNDDGTLWPGQLATARVLVKTDRNATVVPSMAVQNGQNGPFVFAIKPDSTVAILPVATGPTVGGMTALLSGVQPGQDIVVSGQSRLTGGTKVSAVPQAGASENVASIGSTQ